MKTITNYEKHKTKQNNKITKKTKKTNMNIVSHQEQIMFSEMKMSEHKIMLEMN